MRALTTFVLIVFAIVLFPIAIAAVFLIVQAEVNHTRLFGFGILALFMAVYRLIKHFTTDIGKPALWATLFLLVSIGLFAGSYMTSPTGATKESNTAFESVYDDSAPYPRWHPANLIAERDQVQVALMIAGWLGHDYDDQRGKEARTLMKVTYDDLEYHAEELIDYGTQLQACYEDLLGQPSRIHRYVYRSQKGKAKQGKMPVILLLHGEPGNLKTNLWAITALADEIGMAIVAPTFGLGKWSEEEASKRIATALDYCERVSDLDASKVLLVGCGSAGAGLNAAAKTMAKRFSGFVHISANFTPDTTVGLAENRAMASIPILVLHGADDRLTRVEEVEKAIDGLKRWKMPVTYQRFEEDGAMLLLKRKKDVCHRIATWMHRWRS